MAPYDKFGKYVMYSWQTDDPKVKADLLREENHIEYLKKLHSVLPKPEPKYSWQTNDPIKKAELLRKEANEEQNKYEYTDFRKTYSSKPSIEDSFRRRYNDLSLECKQKLCDVVNNFQKKGENYGFERLEHYLFILENIDNIYGVNEDNKKKREKMLKKI